MPSAIANTTHTNIIKYMFYPPFSLTRRPYYRRGIIQVTLAEAPTRYYRIVMWSFLLNHSKLSRTCITGFCLLAGLLFELVRFSG